MIQAAEERWAQLSQLVKEREALELEEDAMQQRCVDDQRAVLLRHGRKIPQHAKLAGGKRSHGRRNRPARAAGETSHDTHHPASKAAADTAKE